MTKRKARLFRACTLLYHTRKKRLVQPGEITDLSHLNRTQVRELLSNGYIEPVENLEVENGANDQRNLI